MSTHDQVNVQLSANTSDNVFAKHDTCTPRTSHTALNTIFRIGPEQVELNCWVCRVEVRHRATERAQLVQTSQTIRDSTDPPANQSSEWQPSERFVECYPERLSVVWESSADLLEEPIDTVDVATFMVAAQQEEICRISCLVGQKQDSCLNALTAAVDRWKANSREDAHQVRKLSMDVTAYDHWRIDLHKRRLNTKNFNGAIAQSFDVRCGNLKKLEIVFCLQKFKRANKTHQLREALRVRQQNALDETIHLRQGHLRLCHYPL
uniref:Uncharacterized protein n=1 Tax=Meloidogyne incognita TaxID=6306 RepID=A0A914NDR5_MELIC